MSAPLLPTLPEPDPGAHGHAMPPPLPGRYDEPVDLGTGRAAFFIASVVLALTLAMGIVAIGHLADRDSLALHSQRSVAIESAARLEARTDTRLDTRAETRADPRTTGRGGFIPASSPR